MSGSLNASSTVAGTYCDGGNSWPAMARASRTAPVPRPTASGARRRRSGGVQAVEGVHALALIAR